MGSRQDPYGARCHRPEGHTGKHRDFSPFGEGFVWWNGGGSIAGDALRYTDLEFT